MSSEAPAWNWRPDAIRPCESLWSIVQKFCYLNRIDGRGVSSVWSTEKRSQEDPRPSNIISNASVLNLPEFEQILGVAKGQSEEWIDAPYEPSRMSSHAYFDHRDTQLRYCPKCAAVGYHSPIFQQVGLRLCPIHEVALRSDCEGCGRVYSRLILSTYAAHCWACSCGHSLWPDIAKANWTLASDEVLAPIVHLAKWVTDTRESKHSSTLAAGSIGYSFLPNSDMTSDEVFFAGLSVWKPAPVDLSDPELIVDTFLLDAEPLTEWRLVDGLTEDLIQFDQQWETDLEESDAERQSQCDGAFLHLHDHNPSISSLARQLWWEAFMQEETLPEKKIEVSDTAARFLVDMRPEVPRDGLNPDEILVMVRILFGQFLLTMQRVALLEVQRALWSLASENETPVIPAPRPTQYWVEESSPPKLHVWHDPYEINIEPFEFEPDVQLPQCVQLSRLYIGKVFRWI